VAIQTHTQLGGGGHHMTSPPVVPPPHQQENPELFVATLAVRRQREPNIRREREQHVRQQHHQQQHARQQQTACNLNLLQLTGNGRAGKPRSASKTRKITLFVLLFVLPRERLYFCNISRRPVGYFGTERQHLISNYLNCNIELLYLQLEQEALRELLGGGG